MSQKFAPTIRKVLTVDEAKAQQHEVIEEHLDRLIPDIEKNLLVNLCYTVDLSSVHLDCHRRSLIFQEIKKIFENAGWKVTRYQNNGGRDDSDSMTIEAEAEPKPKYPPYKNYTEGQ